MKMNESHIHNACEGNETLNVNAVISDIVSQLLQFKTSSFHNNCCWVACVALRGWYEVR